MDENPDAVRVVLAVVFLALAIGCYAALMMGMFDTLVVQMTAHLRGALH